MVIDSALSKNDGFIMKGSLDYLAVILELEIPHIKPHLWIIPKSS